MKKLTGMKKNFSLLENKKLSDLKSIVGGSGSTYSIRCNLVNGEGCTDQDHYNDDGSYKRRAWLCFGVAELSNDIN